MTDYNALWQSAESLLDPQVHPLSNLANISALIRFSITDINWSGFYFLIDDVLNLGPFCGLPACIRIPVGRGVCGTALQQDMVLCVPDVHAFSGHIACDCNSRSELVIPIHLDKRVVGVLDIDSPVLNRFGEDELDFFGKTAQRIEYCLAENRTLWKL